jgi:phenylacetyl-CoA:acceptor oxidoreductase subunit 2
LSGSAIGLQHAVALLALIAIRAFVWNGYLAGLTAAGAPEGALRVLNGIAPRLALFGHLLPGLVVVAALAGMPGRGALMFAAGIMVVAGGWFLKYTLVRRAAFTQGLALMRMPVRGNGPAGPAAKPGWKTAQGVKAG